MKKRWFVFAALAVLSIFALNAFAYAKVLNSPDSILNLARKLDFAYVTPKTYIDLAKSLQRKPYYNSAKVKEIDITISNMSEAFIRAAFNRDSKRIDQMLDPSAEYIASKDGSSFIRYIGKEIHVEGYMATDKSLAKTIQRWHVLEDDNTVTCSMEVYIENLKTPQLWYLHFKKVKNEWKLFMLENDI